MADVRPPRSGGASGGPTDSTVAGCTPADRTDRTGHTPADRGQLLLVGALALAVLFVSLALLLNTAIYTGNLATRDPGVDAAPTIEYVEASRAAGVDALGSVNHRNNSTDADGHAELAAALRDTVSRWDGLASHHRAVAGDAAAVEVVAVTNGTRIQQDDASRNFTSDAWDETWTVAEGSDLSGIRTMRLRVDQSALAGAAGDAFRVNVTSGGTTRTLSVYENGGETAVRVTDDGTVLSTRSFEPDPDGTVVIDVSNGSVGGESYSDLRTVLDVGVDTAITYHRGGNATGTYTMVVDEPTGDLAHPGLLEDDLGQPYWTHAVYGAEFRVTYRTPDLDYEARIEVVPR
ncbi:hypothetical protein [Halobellus sp. GM3]|uniref:hypothetical protein n=1 Tax=Halobellus sp. GM3 TaxID=3458410 RepID=UPI00403D70DB